MTAVIDSAISIILLFVVIGGRVQVLVYQHKMHANLVLIQIAIGAAPVMYHLVNQYLRTQPLVLFANPVHNGHVMMVMVDTMVAMGFVEV